MQIAAIWKIRKYINEDTVTFFVNALVVSKLYCCNGLLYLLHKLQIILNSAARLVILTHKANHITPILCKRHWLQVLARIDYNIFIMVYKWLNCTAPKYLRAMFIFQNI